MVAASTSYPDLKGPPQGYRIKRKPPPAVDISERYPSPDPLDPFAPLWLLRSRTSSSLGINAPCAYPHPYPQHGPYGSQDTLNNNFLVDPERRQSRARNSYLYATTTTNNAQTQVSAFVNASISPAPVSPISATASPPPKVGHYRPYSQTGFNLSGGNGGVDSGKQHVFPLISSPHTSQTNLGIGLTYSTRPWPATDAQRPQSRRADLNLADSSGTETESDASVNKPSLGLKVRSNVAAVPLRRTGSNNSTTAAAAHRFTKFLLPRKTSFLSGSGSGNNSTSNSGTNSITTSPASTASHQSRRTEVRRRGGVSKSSISAPVISTATWSEPLSKNNSRVDVVAIEARTRSPTPIINGASRFGKGDESIMHSAGGYTDSETEVKAPLTRAKGNSRPMAATMTSAIKDARDADVHVNSDSPAPSAPGATIAHHPNHHHHLSRMDDDDDDPNGMGTEKRYSFDTDIGHYLRPTTPTSRPATQKTTRNLNLGYRLEKTLPVEPFVHISLPLPLETTVPAKVPAPAPAPVTPPPLPPKMFRRRMSSAPMSLSVPMSPSVSPGGTGTGTGLGKGMGIPLTHSISNSSIVNINISSPSPAPSFAYHTEEDAFTSPRPAPRPPQSQRAQTVPPFMQGLSSEAEWVGVELKTKTKKDKKGETGAKAGKEGKLSKVEDEVRAREDEKKQSKQGKAKAPKVCAKATCTTSVSEPVAFPSQSRSFPHSHSRSQSTLPLTVSPSPEWAHPTPAQLTHAAALPLTAEDGTRIAFGTLFASQRTIVVFIRHFWCPLCQDYMSALTALVRPDMLVGAGGVGTAAEGMGLGSMWEDDENEGEGAGGASDKEKAGREAGNEKKGEKKKGVRGEPKAQQKIGFVVISNGAHGMIAKYRHIFGLPFRVYTDPSLAVYKALGMGRDGDVQVQQQHQQQQHRQHPEHDRTGDASLQPEKESGKEKEKPANKPDGGYVKHGLMSGIAMVVMRAIKVGMPVWEKGGDINQLGGEFVLGPGLTCSYAHRMQTTKGHAPIHEVLQAAGVRVPSPLPPSPTPASPGNGRHGHSRSEAAIINLSSSTPPPLLEKSRPSRKRRESMKTLRDTLALARRDSRRYSIGMMSHEEEEQWMEHRQRSIERLQERKNVRRVHGAMSRSSSALGVFGCGADGEGAPEVAEPGGAGCGRPVLEAVGELSERSLKDRAKSPLLPSVEADTMRQLERCRSAPIAG